MLNDSDFAFLPKGDNATGSLTTDRAPEDTRPLSLKNTDVKAIAGAANFSLKAAVRERIHPSQQGFVPTRNFTKHIVLLDAEMRTASLSADAATKQPTFTSFDFAAAFPSLGRAWLFCALEQFGLPQGYLNLFHALYYAPNSYVKVDGLRFAMFALESGVAQGCPASGSAWAIAMDLLLRHLCTFVEDADGLPDPEKGYVGGCADDVGLLSIEFDTLRKAHEPMAAAESNISAFFSALRPLRLDRNGGCADTNSRLSMGE